MMKMTEMPMAKKLFQQSHMTKAVVLSFLLSPNAVLAADWGYDDSKKPEELKASPAKSLHPKSANPFARTPAATAKPAPHVGSESAETGALSATQGTLPGVTPPPSPKPVAHAPAKPPAKAPGAKPKPATAAKPSAATGKSASAVDDWLQLFDLVSKEQITADQKARYREALTHKLATERGAEVSQITQFWPEVRGRIKNSEDEKTAFASFFRALLRFVLKSKNCSEDDATILTELLGPERIAVPGDPPLTEDSVDAYGDMACFMYEQAHPGKTVDAIDNRTVFASVIARKYTEAPTDKDKRAMSNFSLSWTKFKVMWLSANESDRKQLYEQIAMGKPPASDVKDPLITTIFANGPWHSK